MSLRVLKIRAELKTRNAALEKLTSQKSDFDKRKKDLETALKEAESEEDINLVSGQIDELEKEIDEADTDGKIKAEQDEIDKLNSELSEIEKPAEPEPIPEPRPDNSERGVKNMLTKRTIFGALPEEKRSAVLASEGVKSFLASVRSIMSGTVQERGVNNGTLTIPIEFLDLIRPSLGKYSKLYEKISNKKVRGESRQLIAGTAPEGIWTEQYAAVNELEISFNQISVGGYKIGGYIAVENALLEDSDENLADEILEALARSIGIGYDKAVLFGTGVRMPLGIATRLAQTVQPSDWDAKQPAWTDLHETHILKMTTDIAETKGADFFAALYGLLSVAHSDYATGGLTWVMNRKTKTAIIQKSVGLDASAALVTAVKNEMPIVGGEIIELEFMANGDILGGYFDLYRMAERSGSSFAQSTDVRFLEEQTVFKGTARYDGKPVFGEAFVMVNISNTEPTTTTTFAGDKANKKLVSLSSLTVGSASLFPPFDPNVLNYTTKVTAHSQKITATALTNGAVITIKNGETAVTNEGNATFKAGDNILTIEVSNGNAEKRTYTVTVDDQTA